MKLKIFRKNIWKKKQDLSFDETVKINYSRAPYGRTIFEQASWATDIEPMKFLKGKNRYYSFHEKKDAENTSDGNLKLIWKKNWFISKCSSLGTSLLLKLMSL